MGDDLTNRKMAELISEASPRAVDAAALFLTMRLSGKSGRTYELGDATIDDIKLRQTANAIHISFRLKNEMHHIVRDVTWGMMELLVYSNSNPITVLLERELDEAIVDLLIQDEKKVRSILKKAAR